MHHTTSIEREYDHARQVHVWWFQCACGVAGEKRLSPRQAERDEENHVWGDAR